MVLFLDSIDFTLNSFNYAEEYQRIPAGWDGAVYDIPLRKVAIGLLLAMYGSVVGLVVSMLIVAIKFIPLPVTANVHYFENLKKRNLHLLLLLLLGWAALNLLSPLALAAAALYGFSCLSQGLHPSRFTPAEF